MHLKEIIIGQSPNIYLQRTLLIKLVLKEKKNCEQPRCTVEDWIDCGRSEILCRANSINIVHGKAIHETLQNDLCNFKSYDTWDKVYKTGWQI